MVFAKADTKDHFSALHIALHRKVFIIVPIIPAHFLQRTHFVPRPYYIHHYLQ
jgi:hypothetical protein